MVGKVFTNLGAAFSTSFGWGVALLSAFATIIAPEKTSFIVVAGAILADLFWGVAAAIKLKKFFLSTALRDTVKKIGIYSFAMLGAMAIESISHAEGTFVAIRTIAVKAAVCEFWSMSASMLIVYPNMPFLKLLRGQLKGEIQSKVSKNVNVDDILNDDNDDTEISKR